MAWLKWCGLRLQASICCSGCSRCVFPWRKGSQSLTSAINHTLGLIDSAPVLTQLPHQIFKEAAFLTQCWVLLCKASINGSCSLQKLPERRLIRDLWPSPKRALHRPLIIEILCHTCYTPQWLKNMAGSLWSSFGSNSKSLIKENLWNFSLSFKKSQEKDSHSYEGLIITTFIS